MDRPTTFARNVASLTTANFLANAVGAVVTILVINHLGDERYGAFKAAMSFATVFLVLAETGVGMRFLYDCSGDKSRIEEHFGAVLFLQAVPYLASLLLTVACAFLFRYSYLLIGLVALVSVAAVFRIFAETCEKVLTVYQHLHLAALLRTIRFMSIAVGGVLVVWLNWDVVAWALVQVVSMLLYAVCTTAVTFRFVWPRLTFAMLWPTLTASYIFGLGSIFFAIYENVDTVMLTKLLPAHALERVGIYGAAYVIMTFTYTLPAAFIASMEPLVFAARDDLSQLARLGGLSNRGIAIIAVPLNLAIAILAPNIRALILPDIGQDAALVLSILAWYGFVRFMNFPAGMMMVAAGMQTRRVFVQAAAVVFNIAGNLYMIRRYDIFGAAMMTVATELLIFAAYNWLLRHRLSGYYCFGVLAKPVLAAAAMGALVAAGTYATGVFLPGNKFAWLAMVPVGAAFYFGALAALRFFSEEEKAFVRRLFARLHLTRSAV